MPLKEIDLRPISQQPDRLSCEVYMRNEDHREVLWMTLGAASIRTSGNGQSLIARMDATDFEHDSAYVLVLPLIGVTFDTIQNHTTILTAWIDPDAADEFAVPSTGYDPRKHKDAFMCDDECCEEPHPIVPEGYYTPPHNKKLYAAVSGKRVKIRFGPVWKDGEAQ